MFKEATTSWIKQTKEVTFAPKLPIIKPITVRYKWSICQRDTTALVSNSAIRIERENIPPDPCPHVATASGEQIACRAGGNRDDCKTELDTAKFSRSTRE
jgi:hypothetical protein